MTARVKLGAQALAVGLVLALLALLIWKVAFKNNGGGVAAKIDKGKITVAPDFVLNRLDRPGKLNVGTVNPGSTQHLSALLLKSTAGIEFQWVPFRNSPDLLVALLAWTRRLGRPVEAVAS